MAEAMTPRPLVAGNWKMNGLRAATSEFGKILNSYDETLQAAVDLAVCPPTTLLMAFAVTARETHVAVGAQDCHPEPSGAHTGDVSAEMLADAGAVCIIVGHSERRANHGETDEIVRAKADAVRRTGLVAIVCVGETEAERNEGRALDVVGRQLEGSLPAGMSAAELIVAYEPVWAIGTGRTPTLDDIAEMHAFIRERLVAMYETEGMPMRILYGGSVKPSNAGEILKVPNVDGALVGGASLKADDFLAIASAYR